MATSSRSASGIDPASFRDPSGFVFRHDGSVYRQVNPSYREDYDRLIDSGLYNELTRAGLLIEHEEMSAELAQGPEAYKIIRPQPVRFISYPYEWSFSQLKDAALATIDIQKRALDKGQSLKDCSAYNIQFHNGRPVFIDTLSFEKYKEGAPWIAYRQFCQHFLAPLALISYVDVRLNQLSRIHIDGIPLDVTSTLLPGRTYLRPALLSHVHLHAKAQKRYADKPVDTSQRSISRMALLGLIDNLGNVVNSLEWRPHGTEWGEYYEDTNYSDAAVLHKLELVGRFLDTAAPGTVWDVGANTGLFSRVASERGIPTIAFDIDPAAVEKNYREVCAKKETGILPLILDLTNPSPGIGWANDERQSLADRGPAELGMALALVHHLAISNNLPMQKIAGFFSKICRWLIIEFVPKSDSQVQRLLTTRQDIFPEYRQDCFEQEFAHLFEIHDQERVSESERTLYLMRAKST